MKNLLCIVNPVSGLKKSLKVFNEVKNRIESSNIKHELFVSKFPNHIKDYISKINKNEFDKIIIFGGDGTLNEVVNGLNSSNNLSNFKLGIIPTGSGNSVAHDIGSLKLDIAIKKCLGEKVIKMDVNQVKFDSFTRLSVSVLGWGMFSFGNIRAEKLRFLGPMRYDVASIVTLLEKKIHKAEMVVDGVKKTLECAFIVGCNSIHSGKGMIVAPKGGFYDGKIDIITVDKKVNRLQVFKVFQRVYKGTHINLPYVKNIKAESFSLDAGKNSFYNIDGDIVYSQKALVSVIPKAINLLI